MLEPIFEIVGRAVNFNNHSCSVTAEVRDIRPDWSLPPEL
jgi:hypothetical protein